MKTVEQLLQSKGRDVWGVAPTADVYEAIQAMADRNVGALLVLEAGRLVGVISERDLARKLVLKGKSPMNTPVSDIMTKTVVCTRPDQTVEECMALMTNKRVRHLPVISENDVVGLISIGDVVKSIISAQEFIIGQLENYISGAPS